MNNIFQIVDPLKIIFYLALLYFAALFVLFVLQRDFIYITSTPRAPFAAFSAIPGLKEVTVKPEGDLSITGWFVPPAKEGAPVITFFHGNASNLSMTMSGSMPYLKEGYGFLVAEYRGYSGNKGKPNEKNLYEDARAWINFLIREGYGENRIILFGESLGSGVAVQMATEYKDIKAIVLISPYTRLVDVARVHYPFFPVRYLMHDKYASIDKLDKLQSSVFIIHGNRDRIVPVQMAQTLFEGIKVPKDMKIVQNAGHNDLYLNGANAYILQFLQSLD